MNELRTSSDPSQNKEIIYQVTYQRLTKKTVACTLAGMGISYLRTQSPIMTLLTGIFCMAILAKGGVGHASLYTPSKKIASQSAASFPIKNSKFPENIIDNPKKNPRIFIRIPASDSQIKLIESSRIVLSTTCSHGSSRLLANAGLPHSFFPFSLSPTWTAYHLHKQQKKNPNIKVQFINWTKDSFKPELKIANFLETFLILIALGILSISGIEKMNQLI